MTGTKGIRKPRVAYEERRCVSCGAPFSVRNNNADRNQRACSKVCATKARHAGGWKPNNLGKNWNKNPALRPTTRPSTHDIVWAAGIFEGEGSVRSPKHSPNGVQLHVGQKDQWVVQKLRARFGGSIHVREMNGAPFHDWHLSGARARGFLMTILMFMSPRRHEQIVSACNLAGG